MTFYSVFYIFILILFMMQGKKTPRNYLSRKPNSKVFKMRTHLPFIFNCKLPWYLDFVKRKKKIYKKKINQPKQIHNKSSRLQTLAALSTLHIRLKNQQYHSALAKPSSPAPNCHLLWVLFIIVKESVLDIHQLLLIYYYTVNVRDEEQYNKKNVTITVKYLQTATNRIETKLSMFKKHL